MSKRADDPGVAPATPTAAEREEILSDLRKAEAWLAAKAAAAPTAPRLDSDAWYASQPSLDVEPSTALPEYAPEYDLEFGDDGEAIVVYHAPTWKQTGKHVPLPEPPEAASHATVTGEHHAIRRDQRGWNVVTHVGDMPTVPAAPKRRGRPPKMIDVLLAPRELTEEQRKAAARRAVAGTRGSPYQQAERM